MATFTNLDQEKIAEADKHEQRKANTLGSDKPYIEEPFGSSEIVLREDIFSETPTASTNFASPNYGEWPEGAVASRREKVRLHPLITSGMSGLSSIQTFVIVSAAPASDNPEDIEAVRIKHIVPPDLSLGRANAAHANPNFRGFELALFPACSVVDASSPTGSSLDAYDGYGSIPISADPSAAYGIGEDARWTVDYANGIVRFTDAPLNGATGVMNPFNVYGDINGYERSEGTGRITMFATFYQYTGPTLTDSDDVRMVTVGDGTNSFGTYYGPTSTVMQMAIDSLSPYGGTVYLKEGDYTYTTDVQIPDNVMVIGLSKRAEISRPASLPAFTVHGSDTAVTGVTIKTIDSGGSQTIKRADIELATRTASQTLQNVRIENNELWATHDAYGVGFAPKHLNATYKNISIKGNIFDSPSFERPVYIGNYIIEGLTGAPSVSLENIDIRRNDFRISGTAIDGYAVYFEGGTSEGGIIEDIRELHIVENNMATTADIGIDVDIILENIHIENNSEFRNIHLNGLSGSTIRDNIFNDAHLDGYITDSQFKDNIVYSVGLYDTVSDFGFTGNTCFGKVRFKADNASADWEINGVNISDNKFHEDLEISGSLRGMGQHNIKNLSITNNAVATSINFATSAYVTGTIIYTDLKVTGNTIGDADAPIVNSINFGDDSNSGIYLSSCTFSDNILHGDIVFNNRVYLDADTAGLELARNTFVGNKGIYWHSHKLHNVLITDNRLNNIDLFYNIYSGDSADGGNSDSVVIKNNMMMANSNITLHDMVAASSGFTLQGCTIEDNVFDTTGSISVMESLADTNDYTFNDLSVSGNKLVTGSINIGGTLDSDSNFNDLAVKNNWVYGGAIDIAAAVTMRAHITGNLTGTDLVLNGDVTNSIVSDNIISEELDINGDLNYVVISANNVGYVGSNGIDFAGTIDNSTILGNSVNGLVWLHNTCTDSKLTANRIEGNLTVAAMTRSTVDDNSVLGGTGVTSTTWTDSVFTNNDIDQALTATSWTNSICTGNTIGTSASLGALTQSIVSNCVLITSLTAGAVGSSRIIANTIGNSSLTGNVVSLTSLADSSFSDNTILRDATNSGTGGINISSTVQSSHVDDNSCDGDLLVGGTISAGSTICNNNARTFGFGNVIDSTVIGNVVDSGSLVAASAVALVTGDLTNSIFADNLFKSTSAAADITIGDCDEVTFTGNLIFAEAGQKITFDTLTKTEISNCNLQSDTLEIISLTDSKIDNCMITSDFTIPTLAGVLFNNSFITNTEITGVVTLTNSSTSAMFWNSTFRGNLLSYTGGPALIITTGDKAFERSHFDNNTISHDTVIDIASDTSSHYWLLDSTFNDNVFIGNVTCTGVSSASYATYISDSIITDNVFNSDLSIGADLHTSTGGSLLDDSILSSNTIGGVFSIGPSGRTAVTYQNSVITDNSFASNVTMNGGLSGCSMQANVVKGNVATGTLSGTTLLGNVIGSDGSGNLTLRGVTQNSVCSSNTINGTFEIDNSTGDGTVSSSTITTNTVNSTFTIDGAITDAVIDGNNIIGVITIDNNISDSVFNSNHAVENVVFNGTVSSCVIDSNELDDSKIFNFTGTLGGSAAAGNTISGNRCGGLTSSSTCSYNTITANHIYGTLTLSSIAKSYLNITSNKITTVSVGVGLSDSVFNDNIVTGSSTFSTLSSCTLNDNILAGAISLAAIGYSNISNNLCGSTLSMTSTVTECFIENNRVAGDLSVTSTTTHTIFDGNILSGGGTYSADLGGLFEYSTFTNNIIDRGLRILNNVTEAIISGNGIDEQFDITGSVSNSSISNNVVRSGTSNFNNAFTSTVFEGNYIYTSVFSGTFSDCTVTGNVFADSASFSTIDGCTITSNQFDGATSTGSVTNSTIAGNNTDSTFGTSTLSGVNINSNVFGSSFSTGQWTDVTCIGNTFNSTISMGSYTLNESSIGNNIFNSTFTSGRWTDVSCSGNTFNSSFTVTETGTSTACITRVAFQGNVCKGLIQFAKSGAGNTNNFIHSTFSGNVFHVGLVLGSSGVANEHTRIAITGNSGAGYVTIHAGPNSEMDSCMIVANTMTGALSLLLSSAGDYDIPPVTPTSDPMVALNWFNSYSGIIFTNHAIGWGNTTAANTGTTAGSNRTSTAS